VCVSEEASHVDWGWRITRKQTDGEKKNAISATL